MDLRDYLVMLRRGWPTIVALALLGLALASAYLFVTPKTFQTSSTLIVAVNNPSNIGDAQVGTQLAGLAANTYAGVIRSPVVLESVAQRLRPQQEVGTLLDMVSATQRPDTSLIDITVAGSDPEQVAQIANTVSEEAQTIIPPLLIKSSKTAPLVLNQVSVASTPTAPTSPSTRPVLAIGALVGLAIGVGVAIARQALDTSIRSADDVQRSGGGAVLGAVPRPRRKEPVLAGDQWGRLAERYRALRTNVGFGRDESRRSVLIAPVHDIPDAHLVAANLAMSISRTSRSVLLVDLNLRSSPLRDVFRIERAEGLGDVLSQRMSLTEAVVRVGSERLFVLPAGTSQPHPSDLLSSPAMTGLIREMEAAYDHVIVSASSLLSYTDASVVATDVRSTILTVASGKTKAASLTTAVAALRHLGVTTLGCVIIDQRFSWTSRGNEFDARPGSGGSRRTPFRRLERSVAEAEQQAALAEPPQLAPTRGAVRRRSAHEAVNTAADPLAEAIAAERPEQPRRNR